MCALYTTVSKFYLNKAKFTGTCSKLVDIFCWSSFDARHIWTVSCTKVSKFFLKKGTATYSKLVDSFCRSSFDAETHVELSLVQEFQNSSLTKGIFSKKLYYSLQLSFCLILSKVKPTYKTISWNGNRVIFVWCFYKRRSRNKNKLFIHLFTWTVIQNSVSMSTS